MGEYVNLAVLAVSGAAGVIVLYAGHRLLVRTRAKIT